MPESDNLKHAHSWRSRFRSRTHDAAHEKEQTPDEPLSRDDVPRGKAHLITTNDALDALIGRLRAAGSFAFDSEFIGELSYVPKLCLIQIATTSEIALVDPLAGFDLLPLWELLCDRSVEKVVHAGAQDVEPPLRIIGRPAANVVDTQIAAGFARMPYPVSLQRLLLQLLGVRLGKGLTFTHWDQRPLSAQQLRYAADDVRYLPAAWAELRKSADSAGTLDWIRNECETMCANTPYQFDRETSYLKVRGSGSLDRRQLGILRELAAWRDASAREADLPPRTFLRDEIMIELCRRSPATADKLMQIQGLPRPVRAAHAQKIIEAISAARSVDAGPELRKSEELPRQQFQVDGIYALAQALCLARGVDPQLAFARADIGDLLRRTARKQPVDRLRVMQGWRREVVGNTLAELCRDGGQVSVALASHHLSLPATDRPSYDSAGNKES